MLFFHRIDRGITHSPSRNIFCIGPCGRMNASNSFPLRNFLTYP